MTRRGGSSGCSEVVKQQLRRLPLVLARPAHGGQRHAQEIPEGDVPRADDRDVFRHAQPGVPDRLHRADRRGIVGGEHRVDAAAAARAASSSRGSRPLP